MYDWFSVPIVLGTCCDPLCRSFSACVDRVCVCVCDDDGGRHARRRLMMPSPPPPPTRAKPEWRRCPAPVAAWSMEALSKEFIAHISMLSSRQFLDFSGLVVGNGGQ